MSHRVVVIGGGFGGLYTAQRLRRAPVEVTLIDRRNHHLFQPLLYQTATGGLAPGDIASPIRYILRKQRNARVIMDEVTDLDVRGRRVLMRAGDLAYDTLVVAAGVRNHYFGHDDWEPLAPGLKSIEDALTMRRRILGAFEQAELETDAARRDALLTFVVIGAGSTGVELAGAVGELAHHTLRGDFRRINPRDARVFLVEGADRVLPDFPPSLSARARRSLEKLGIEVRTGTIARTIDARGVELECSGTVERLPARTVLWAAGIAASPLGQRIQSATGCEVDRHGRIRVGPDLTVPDHPDLFVIGDLAHVEWKGRTLPGIAPAAIQEGKYAARLIRSRVEGKRDPGPFTYFDKGSLATIGRAAAVGQFRGLRFWGFPAWLAWLVIHLMYLIEFENRLLVLIQWANTYISRHRGSRLITDHSSPAP